MPFWPFLAVKNVFFCVFKNTDQNKICASIAFKAKTKEKYAKHFFTVFISKLKNALFWGSTNFFFSKFLFQF